MYTLKSKDGVPPFPTPSPPDEHAIYPKSLASINTVELVSIYTDLTQESAYLSYTLASIEAQLVAKKHELDREVCLRFVHSDLRSTTEKKERARAGRTAISLAEERALIEQDALVLRALLDGVRAKLFSVKTELERRRYESA